MTVRGLERSGLCFCWIFARTSAERIVAGPRTICLKAGHGRKPNQAAVAGSRLCEQAQSYNQMAAILSALARPAMLYTLPGRAGGKETLAPMLHARGFFCCSVENQIDGVTLTSLTPIDPSSARAQNSMAWVLRHNLAPALFSLRRGHFLWLLPLRGYCGTDLSSTRSLTIFRAAAMSPEPLNSLKFQRPSR